MEQEKKRSRVDNMTKGARLQQYVAFIFISAFIGVVVGGICSTIINEIIGNTITGFDILIYCGGGAAVVWAIVGVFVMKLFEPYIPPEKPLSGLGIGNEERLKILVEKYNAGGRLFKILMPIYALGTFGLGIYYLIKDKLGKGISTSDLVVLIVLFVPVGFLMIISIPLIIITSRRTKKLLDEADMTDEGIVCFDAGYTQGDMQTTSSDVYIMVSYVENIIKAVQYGGGSPPKSKRYKKGDVVQIKWNSKKSTVCYIVDKRSTTSA